MVKISVEICIISARGVRASPSLWKHQWYAVGWVDPTNKYITKVDASTNTNPHWRTKFSVPVDNSDPSFHDLVLNVEVYSRDPFFFSEKLHGSATVLLKEFLAKEMQNEEIGSYQLRKKKDNKPRGFVDVSVRVFEDKEESNSYSGNEGGGIILSDNGGNKGGNGQRYHQQMDSASFNAPFKQAQTNVPYSHPMPFPSNYSNPYVGGPTYPAAAGAGPSYQPLRTPPPPPPHASNFGYVPTFHQSNDGLAPSYFNMPSSSGTAPRQRGPPGFAMGAGAGALAAGAVMFGDNLMSGFDFSSGIGDPALSIATDPLF